MKEGAEILFMSLYFLIVFHSAHLFIKNYICMYVHICSHSVWLKTKELFIKFLNNIKLK